MQSQYGARMGTSVSIDRGSVEPLSGVLEGDGSMGILLAHGAGAGQQHPFMVGMRERLAARGYLVLSFDYPYMAAGRKAPDRLPMLVEAHTAAADYLAARASSLVFAGKSMGGRVGSHVEGFDDRRRVFLGYPLVALGKSEPRDTSHLDRLTAGMLFVQGEKDRMGPLELVKPVVRRVGASLHVVVDGDHSFKVPKKTGRSEDDVLDEISDVMVAWLGE